MQQLKYELIHGDTMTHLSQIDKMVDVIFADPPYFLSNGGKTMRGNRIVSVNKGEWDMGGTPEYIYEFNKKWLSLCRDVLKEDGTIWICGTFHNIYSVGLCLIELGYKILNVITWQKTDPPPSLTGTRFNFSSEFIIWAAKSNQSKYFLNFELMKTINGGKQMNDVWKIPSVSWWEKLCGKHPTQKPLRLLYRIILSSTRQGETILDPFAGSCTTGIAANLLGRNFIGIEQDNRYIELGKRRKLYINDPIIANKMLFLMSENPEETQVLINHTNPDLQKKMIEKGITYMRAGDSRGSILITPGFERMGYVLLHTNGNSCHLYKLKRTGCFQIWTKETLEQYGFTPEHASYYMVLHFDNSQEIEITNNVQLRQGLNTYISRIRPLSDFVGI